MTPSRPAGDIGGKAASLVRLVELGMPVPPFFILPAIWFDRMLAPLRQRIGALLRELPAGDEAAARAAHELIARWIDALTIPSGLHAALADGLHQLLDRDARLAVRSSGLGEDGDAQSYAGLFTTELNLARADLDAAVRRCYAAVFSPRALHYRRARHHDVDAMPMALIVQMMIDARVSGVGFTADPLTGDPGIDVVAGYGLGEGVVADLVECDRYRQRPDTLEWQRDVRTKTRGVTLRGAGGTALTDVPIELRDRAALNAHELDTLAGLMRQIELAAGCPQDVEWCIDRDGRWWILQARPITTAGHEPVEIWDDANIGESYPGITTPLTFSFVRRTYERLFGRALGQVGISTRSLSVLAPSLAHLIGTIRGRLYFNLTGYYRLFAAVPGLESDVAKWETAFGIDQHFDMRQLNAGRRRCTWRTLAPVRTAWHLGRRFLGMRREVRRFLAAAESLVARYEQEDLASRSSVELLDMHRRICHESLDGWTVLIFNDLFTVQLVDRLARFCGDDQALHQRLLRGSPGMESLASVKALEALIESVRSTPSVANLLTSDSSAEVAWQRLPLLPDAAEFQKEAERYLARFGERTIEELKLETSSLAERPWLLLDLIRHQLEAGVHRDRVAPGADLDDAAAALLDRAGVLRRPLARWILARSREGIAVREDLSYARARIYAFMRRLFRAMGTALCREGDIDDPDAIYYLTLEDLENYIGTGLPESELRSIVAQRRSRFALFADESPPHRIVCRGPAYRELRRGAQRVSSRADGGQRRGIPCSAGLVRGVARVLVAPSLADRVDGEILVAPATEPAWVFLMLQARGVIVERGSILSHAAIIGRELGIPTIVGAEDATRWIRSGDLVEMDGATGLIRVISRNGGEEAVARLDSTG